MSFNRENLTIVTNSLKNGVVPSLFAYYNEDNDTITGADFFDDRRLRLGDQLMVWSADKSTLKFYVVSAVTIKAGTATVVASDFKIDDLDVDVIDFGTNTIYDGNMTGNWAMNGGNLSGMGTLGCGAITSSGKIETTSTDSDSIKTAGGIESAGTVKVGAYTLPATDGTDGQVLVTNGAGVLTWTTL
jgi:hypothetical protein